MMAKKATGAEQERTIEELEAEAQAKRQVDFRGRVERVLAVMKEQRIDWRGVPVVTQDGRIGVKVVPVEMQQKPA